LELGQKHFLATQSTSGYDYPRGVVVGEEEAVEGVVTGGVPPVPGPVLGAGVVLVVYHTFIVIVAAMPCAAAEAVTDAMVVSGVPEESAAINEATVAYDPVPSMVYWQYVLGPARDLVHGETVLLERPLELTRFCSVMSEYDVGSKQFTVACMGSQSTGSSLSRACAFWYICWPAVVPRC
jgi:hypothetical protein